ncbi:MAG: hypothetical protein EPO21_08985 [Chloroflexota bacterium]|nr:MAG: hypothetical protein EPO21_08985 [Chloroflexota bacterium]
MWRQIRRPSSLVFSPPAVVVLYVLFSPVLSVLHELLIWALAVLLRFVAAPQLATRLATRFGFDPVYSSVFDRTIGNIQVTGLSVEGSLGASLHQLAPWFFAPADKVASGAWVSVVLDEGAAILPSAVAAVGSEAMFIVAGLILMAIGLSNHRVPASRGSRTLIILGVLLQGSGILGLLGIQFTVDDLESMGLSQVFTKLVPLDAVSYERLVVSPLRTVGPIAIPILLVLSIYGPVLILGWLCARLSRRAGAMVRRGWSGMLGLCSVLLAGRRSRGVVRAMVVVSIGVLAVVVPQQIFPAQANYDNDADQLGLSVGDIQRLSLWSATSRRDVPAGPSTVEITGSRYSYVYLVNGHRERIRGVGYNVMYDQLSAEEREARIDRDFRMMRAAGVNTILGWDPKQFDELTMSKAQEYGLGVVMPYHLPPDGPYADSAYQQQVEADVLQWVTRHKDQPALRMWGIGNEVLHGMAKNLDSPNARAFGPFLVKLADKVHALDPAHPVTYRDAEDVFIKPLKAALETSPQHRPWLVYGVNFFTYRICNALRDWDQKGLDVPLMVSEFAPSGLSRDDRARGYRRMWQCIADSNSKAMGGFAYVWSVNGPEAIDRSLGLVNADNGPTDNSFQFLSEDFRLDAIGR